MCKHTSMKALNESMGGMDPSSTAVVWWSGMCSLGGGVRGVEGFEGALGVPFPGMSGDSAGAHFVMALLAAYLVMCVSSVQLLSPVRLPAIPWTAVRQASLSITDSWSLLKLMCIESVMPSSHLILCHPLLLPSVFPSIREMSQFFTSGGQSIGASASLSVLPVNIQDWISFRIDLFDLLGLSRVFSSTSVQKHQFFGAQLSLWSSSHIHT